MLTKRRRVERSGSQVHSESSRSHLTANRVRTGRVFVARRELASARATFVSTQCGTRVSSEQWPARAAVQRFARFSSALFIGTTRLIFFSLNGTIGQSWRGDERALPPQRYHASDRQCTARSNVQPGRIRIRRVEDDRPAGIGRRIAPAAASPPPVPPRRRFR